MLKIKIFLKFELEKFRFLQTEFLIKGKIRFLGVKNNRGGLEEKFSLYKLKLIVIFNFSHISLKSVQFETQSGILFMSIPVCENGIHKN
jgi:hypothetical protein